MLRALDGKEPELRIVVGAPRLLLALAPINERGSVVSHRAEDRGLAYLVLDEFVDQGFLCLLRRRSRDDPLACQPQVLGNGLLHDGDPGLYVLLEPRVELVWRLGDHQEGAFLGQAS